MSFDFSSRMHDLWRLRFLQRNREARRGLQILREEMSDLTSEQQTEAEVLAASLLRTSGDMSGCNQSLIDLQSRVQELPFQFYIQRGINIFVEGEYALALEYFIRGRKKVKTDFDILVADLNILLCLENLNFDTSEKLSEAQKILKRLKDPDMNAAVEQHLLSFLQRQHFRQGQIAKAVKSEDKEFNHAFFYRQWVAQLPYVQSPKKYDQAKLAALFADQELHLKNFRVKTLLGDPRLTEEDNVELREYIDRLYLWTWRWLTSNSEHHHENLKGCLENFRYPSFHKKMTGEDILMLRNSLQWILLFQPANSKFIAPVLNLLSTLKVESTPIFEIEEMLIAYLAAVKKKEKSKAAALAKKIRAHDLYLQPGLLFEKWMKEFVKRIQEKKVASQPLSLDLDLFKLVTSREEVVSEPLTKLLATLLERDSLLFAEALEIAFGIDGYDEDIHKVKIHNLLNRLREVLPGLLKVFTRQGRIYLQGNKQVVHLIPRTSAKALLLQKPLLDREYSLSAEVKKASMDRWIHPSLILKRAAGKKHFSRQDLQAMARTSKATTNRWIQKWLDAGLLKKAGHGKSTLYTIEMI